MLVRFSVSTTAKLVITKEQLAALFQDGMQFCELILQEVPVSTAPSFWYHRLSLNRTAGSTDLVNEY